VREEPGVAVIQPQPGSPAVVEVALGVGEKEGLAFLEARVLAPASVTGIGGLDGPCLAGWSVSGAALRWMSTRSAVLGGCPAEPRPV